MIPKEQTRPKYIVRRTGEYGIEFFIIHKTVGQVYLVERYDDVPFMIFTVGFVNRFEDDDNIDALKLFEIKCDDVKEENMYYTQEGAIAAAFRYAKEIKEEERKTSERKETNASHQ